MNAVVWIMSFFGLFAVIIGDAVSRRIFSNKAVAGLLLVPAPHFVILFYCLTRAFDDKGAGLLPRIVLYVGLAIFLLYFNLRTGLFPVRLEQDAGTKAKIIYGGRRLIYYALYSCIVQIFLYIFLFPYINGFIEIPRNILVADAVAAGIYIFGLFANGVLRIFCLSKRLRAVRRWVVFCTIWIPFVNILVLLYLCRIAALEYDHDCYKVVNRNARIDSEVCKTKYPLVMLHGVGFRDFKYVNYWGRIPKELIRNGATVYYGNQEAWGTVKDNAEDVRDKIFEVIRETGCEKVNIIAHSKGGLDARYTVSMMGIEDKIASLTTMNSPHRGSMALDYVCRMPDKLFRFIARTVDGYYKKIGDKNPDFYTACQQFTTEYLKEFNEEVTDAQGVYYQSYTSVMKGAASDFLLAVPYIIIKRLEGENDGLVATDSAKWGEFRGVIRNKRHRGISHGDIIDLKREDYRGFDPAEQFVGIVSELKQMGY